MSGLRWVLDGVDHYNVQSAGFGALHEGDTAVSVVLRRTLKSNSPFKSVLSIILPDQPFQQPLAGT
jgi:hypothetical protein